jgi:hypothetical protein
VDKKRGKVEEKLHELIELTCYDINEYMPLNFRVGRKFLEYGFDFVE